MSDKPRRWKAVGVLDIGSNYVRRGSYQAGKGGAQRLELLEHPLRIGHEVFTSGRISVETVRRLSEILRGYSQVMKEYGVTEYRAIATTALREARNRAYVVDQLKTQNTPVLELQHTGEDTALDYAALLGLPGVQAESMLAYIGTGSVGVAAWDGRTIQQTCNITIGFQKLGETLRSLEEQTAGFYKALEEYVETYFRRLTLRLGERRFGSLTLTGRNLEVIAPLCGATLQDGIYRIEKKQLEKLYGRIKGMHAAVAAQYLSLSEEAAEQLLPMLALYLRMLDFTQASYMTAPPVDIMDVAAGQMLYEAQRRAFEGIQRDGAAACAREMAHRRLSDMAHAERVRENAVLLFGKLKKLHGISGKRLVLLECAALLHEVGFGVNSKDSSRSTFDAIKQAYLYGLNEEDTALIGEIARYGDFIEASDTGEKLPEKQRLLVDKLAAMLVLADALDESRKGKITGVRLRLEPDRLVVTASGREEPILERWAFGECAPFFADVFGIQPVLVYKSELLS